MERILTFFISAQIIEYVKSIAIQELMCITYFFAMLMDQDPVIINFLLSETVLTSIFTTLETITSIIPIADFGTYGPGKILIPSLIMMLNQAYVLLEPNLQLLTFTILIKKELSEICVLVREIITIGHITNM